MPTNKKIIIGIVGENASGKTTVTNYICQKYGAVSFRFSDMLSDVLKRLYIPNTRDALQKLSTALRQNFGEDIMSKTLAEDMRKSHADITITEGIRRPSDIEYLKKMEGFILISLDTDAKNRFERLHSRAEKPDDATKTWETFLEESNQESEQKIKEIARVASIHIDNNGSKEDLFLHIDTTLQKLL